MTSHIYHIWDQGECVIYLHMSEGWDSCSGVPRFDPNKPGVHCIRAEVTKRIAWTLFPLGWWICLGPVPSTFCKKWFGCHCSILFMVYCCLSQRLTFLTWRFRFQVGEPNLAVLSFWRGQPSLPLNMAMTHVHGQHGKHNKQHTRKMRTNGHDDFPVPCLEPRGLEARNLRTVEWQKLGWFWCRCRSMYPSVRLGRDSEKSQQVS